MELVRRISTEWWIRWQSEDLVDRTETVCRDADGERELSLVCQVAAEDGDDEE